MAGVLTAQSCSQVRDSGMGVVRRKNALHHCMRLRAVLALTSFAFSSSSTTRLDPRCDTRRIRHTCSNHAPSLRGGHHHHHRVNQEFILPISAQLTRATASSFTNSVAPLAETFAEVAGFLRNFGIYSVCALLSLKLVAF